MIALEWVKGLIGFKDISAFWKIRKHYIQKPSKIYAIVCSVIRRRYGSGIPLSKAIMPFYTPHSFYGIFISQNASIGKGCTIFQQVTIGSNTLSKTIGGPTIGNNVYIGAGAKIIGNIKVGNNVRIGTNAVVVKDIPDNATVVLQQPRVIIHEDRI